MAHLIPTTTRCRRLRGKDCRMSLKTHHNVSLTIWLSLTVTTLTGVGKGSVCCWYAALRTPQNKRMSSIKYWARHFSSMFREGGREGRRGEGKKERREKGGGQGGGKEGGREEGREERRKEGREEERSNLPVSSQVAGMVSSGGRERCWDVVVGISGVPVGGGHMVQEPCLGLYLRLRTTMVAHNVQCAGMELVLTSSSGMLSSDTSSPTAESCNWGGRLKRST